MTAFSMFRSSALPARPRESSKDAVARVVRNATVPTAVARTFAQISAPENKELFSAQAAHKAFSPVKAIS